VGITSIQDMARSSEISRQQLYHANVERSFTDTRIFRDLRDRGELSVRVYAMLPLRSMARLAAAACARARATRGSPSARSRTWPTTAHAGALLGQSR
jgi:hypothetical protein